MLPGALAAGPSGTRRISLAHSSQIHAMEGVYAAFLPHAVSSALVAARRQVLLYSLANCHILELNMMAELDRSHRRITVVGLSDGQIPLEDGQRSLLAKRQHD